MPPAALQLETGLRGRASVTPELVFIQEAAGVLHPSIR